MVASPFFAAGIEYGPDERGIAARAGRRPAGMSFPCTAKGGVMADRYPYHEFRAKRRVVGWNEPDDNAPERDPDGPYPCVMDVGEVA